MSGPNEIKQCPYEQAHRIEAYKLQYHLEKCRKNHPNAPKKTCPFDVRHVINECELEYHVTMCPQRESFDCARYQVDDGMSYKPAAPPAANIVLPDNDENWDSENHQSYNPLEHNTATNVLRRPRGCTPSERRSYRMEQRRHFN